MQRVTPEIGDAFGTVDKVTRNSLMLNLFQGVGEGIMGRGITCLPVKQTGLTLPDPRLMDPENWTASCVITGNIVAALMLQDEFKMENHAEFIRERREYVRKRNERRSEESLTETLAGAPVLVVRHLHQATKTGAWLTVQPQKVNRTELSVQEWRDALLL